MGRTYKHANSICKVCCFLYLLLSLFSDISFWIQFCRRKIRKYPLKDLLYHKFHLSLFLHHLKLHSYMLRIPTRTILMNVITLRLFISIDNLSNSTSHPVLNWQHLKSQVFCPSGTSRFFLHMDSSVLPWGGSGGLVWRAAWVKGRNGAYAFICFSEASPRLKFPSTLKSDTTIKWFMTLIPLRENSRSDLLTKWQQSC